MRIRQWYGLFAVAIVAIGVGVGTLRVWQIRGARPKPVEAAAIRGGGMLPAGHPPAADINSIRQLVAKAEKRARAKSGNIKLWDQFGVIALDGAAYDPRLLVKASQAFNHALLLDPADPAALRGSGDVNYDRRQYDAAITDYLRYLQRNPSDTRVLTDLGTMYLAKHDAAAALERYDQALRSDSTYYPARFNQGVAYIVAGDRLRAAAALTEAHKIAPDRMARLRIEQMIAKLEAPERSPRTLQTTSGGLPVPSSINDQIGYIVQGLPLNGSKVTAIVWPAKFRAVVTIDGLSDGQITSDERTRLIADLRAGIVTAKAAHEVKDVVEVDLRDADTGQTVAAVKE
jgi:tetratricopeptide (TPR) repeat protein